MVGVRMKGRDDKERARCISMCHFARAKPVRDNECTRSGVTLSMSLTKVHNMKAYGQMEVIMYVLVTCAANGVGRSALRSRPLLIQKMSPCIHWIWGCLHPAAWGREKTLCLCRESSFDPLVFQPIPACLNMCWCLTTVAGYNKQMLRIVAVRS
jgi:hypothetical protein